MNINGMVHVNVNCSDFERSRRFYERLGYRVVVDAPDSAGPDVAKAMGMDHYKIKAALLGLEGVTTLIDLIEWKEPRDEAPPYSGLNHLGLARIALSTSNLDADVATLKEAGVEFVSEPVRLEWPPGNESRYVCIKDPDGTVIALVQAGPVG